MNESPDPETLKHLDPEAPPRPAATSFDRREATLIGMLLVAIAAGNFSLPFFPTRSSDRDLSPLTVRQTEESLALGPVDWVSTPNPKPLESFDLNEVTRARLLAIHGIGPSLASAILTRRERVGAFSSVEDLLDVPGIGEKKLEAFRPYFHVAASVVGEATVTRSERVVADSGSSTTATLAVKTVPRPLPNLNEIALEDLERIPGIGPTFAARILETREEAGGFRNWDQVKEVHGIGPKRLENIRKHARLR